MNLQQFEQAVLKLAFETDARITTASVAYYLGIPSREANRLLNQLLEEGVLELDSDSKGNLYYKIPNHGEDYNELLELKRALDGRGQAEAARAASGAAANPAGPTPGAQPRPASSVTRHLASPEDDGEAEPFSPRQIAHRPRPAAPPESRQLPVPVERPAAPAPTPGRVQWAAVADEQPHPTRRDNWGGFEDYYGSANGHDGSSGRANRSPHAVWAGVSTRLASPDASLDRCGSSSVVVGTEVRCEPRPLPSSKPVIVSCSDYPTRESANRTHENLWFGQPAESTAMVAVGEDTALARDYYIEQPEHQPGMALLLSLILCGTGQIYNGEVSKGIMMMVLCFLLWFVLLGWVVHIWSIVDAVVVAERLNRKHA